MVALTLMTGMILTFVTQFWKFIVTRTPLLKIVNNAYMYAF